MSQDESTRINKKQMKQYFSDVDKSKKENKRFVPKNNPYKRERIFFENEEEEDY